MAWGILRVYLGARPNEGNALALVQGYDGRRVAENLVLGRRAMGTCLGTVCRGDRRRIPVRCSE